MLLDAAQGAAPPSSAQPFSARRAGLPGAGAGRAGAPAGLVRPGAAQTAVLQRAVLPPEVRRAGRGSARGAAARGLACSRLTGMFDGMLRSMHRRKVLRRAACLGMFGAGGPERRRFTGACADARTGSAAWSCRRLAGARALARACVPTRAGVLTRPVGIARTRYCARVCLAGASLLAGAALFIAHGRGCGEGRASRARGTQRRQTTGAFTDRGRPTSFTRPPCVRPPHSWPTCVRPLCFTRTGRFTRASARGSAADDRRRGHGSHIGRRGCGAQGGPRPRSAARSAIAGARRTASCLGADRHVEPASGGAREQRGFGDGANGFAAVDRAHASESRKPAAAGRTAPRVRRAPSAPSGMTVA